MMRAVLLLGLPAVIKAQSCGAMSDTCGPFIAEAAEGSSHNKYLEFANPTDSDISLDEYGFPNTSNAPGTPGEYEYWNTFTGGAVIPSMGLYVVCHPSADDAIKAFCDQEFQYLSNGDDGFCLVQGTEADYSLVDCVGDWYGDPGSGWDVCGQGSTKDGTIVRNCDITVGNPDWVATSAADTCEWTRYGQNHWDYGGYFESCAGGGAPTMEELLAACPAEMAACDAAAGCPDVLALALSDGDLIGDEPGFPEFLNVYMCFEGESMGPCDMLATTCMADVDCMAALSPLMNADPNVAPDPNIATACLANEMCNSMLMCNPDDPSTHPPELVNPGGVPPEEPLPPSPPGPPSCGAMSDTCGPFIAEAAEGSSHNKYLEFANPTDSDISLDEYGFPNTSNAPGTPGEYEYWNVFTAGAVIPSMGLYVVCHPSADDAIKAFCDQEFQYLSNGDDGFCLVQGTEADYSLVDCVGDWYGDPGSGWDVCGQGSTKDGTIVRNCDITVGNPDWVATSAADTCEWTRFGQNHWDFGGYFDSCTGGNNDQDLVVPPGVFGIVQSMSFTRGTGDANDIEIVCPTQLAAAEAAAATGDQIDGTFATAFDYFMGVVQANQPYDPNGSESQEFIDMYVCAAVDVPHWNAWDPNAPAPPPGVIDYAAGAHACNGQLGMDYGGNPSYIDSSGTEVSCGYAPVVELVADHADWPAPGWYSGPLTIDSGMDSPLECQARCLANADCDFFSYEWELTAGAMYHECYLKTEYADAACMVDPYVPWSSEDAQWHGESGPGIACAPPSQNACGSFIDMDYGGNPSYIDSSGTEVSCGYAPVVELVADHADWPAPGWYSGPLTIDETMDSPLECQARCLANADCDFYSYEWELTAGGMYHECYLKTEYADAACMVDPYVPWSSEDLQWHGQSGPGIACAPPVSNACLAQVGMDYGGNPSYVDSSGTEVSCGYAPVVAIYADHADWPAPGWYSGPLVVDASMDSPLECQARCFYNADCDFFSYEWELTAGGMYHECYLKTEYADAACMVDPYVPWASEDSQWHGQSGPGISCIEPLSNACGGQLGMDYGGNPSYVDSSGTEVSCGYAPVVAIVADHADWPAPGWYSGPLVVDAAMDSPLECQARCFGTADCDYFSYEWELTAGNMYHECYLKTEYADAACMVDPYVPWSSEDDMWHGQSGQGIACEVPQDIACGAQMGMDYGGNPSYIDSSGTEVSCGYAPVVELVADHADWPAPGWYSGPLTIDASMDDPFECQARCFANADCDFFSYEWELTAGIMYHECYLKASYDDENCMVDPYVPWLSNDAVWYGQSGPGADCNGPTENACMGQVGMDYGGNPSYIDSSGTEVSCGYAPVVELVADHADWPAPGWYSGPLTIDETMDSPLECQARCLANADCDFFSYEWELTANGMYHECYLKTEYADAACMVDPYVPWASEDAYWHGQSGPGIACVPPAEHACESKIGMDYGGNPSYVDYLGNTVSCGYAPIVVIVADHADWQAPGWYGGTVLREATMDSPKECQRMCFDNMDCDFFSYEWELTAGGMYHECYLKTSYDDSMCMVDPYVPWVSEDAQWHGESGPGINCPSEAADYSTMECRLDSNDDGYVGVDDLLAMLATFGGTC